MSYRNLLDEWQAKTGMTIAGVIATETFQLHAILLICFCSLEVIDCLTRWMSISADMLRKEGKDVSIWKAFCAINEARRRRLISSSKMRDAFFSKMLRYLILICGAAIADYMIRRAGQGTSVILTVTVSYISANEFVSILENLADSGCAEAKTLIELITNKIKK